MEIIKNMANATILLVVMISVALFAGIMLMEVLRKIIKKIKPDIIEDETKLKKVSIIETMIACGMLVVILALAKPYVVGFIENLGK